MTINNDDKYIAAVQVNTIGVEKANTIAIYETNGTVFNGHYHEQERMNIIQLYINDSGDDTPFEAGLNTIVIPTSLFTETLFNAYVQNESLSETPIYSSDEETFKFISVGRDGNTEQACDEIDFVIIRFDMSSADGMEILDLLLTCLVNETSNETAVVYSYVSTKLNDTSAVMMSLPISVLQYVPWFCNFCDSLMGEKPETFGNWFWKSLNTLVNLLIGVIITIVMAIVELVKLIIDFFIFIFMDVLPILGYILWLIIRVALLIFIWIIFVFAILIIFTVFFTIVGLLYTMSIFIEVQITTKINEIQMEGDINLVFGYNMGIEYNEFLEFEIPVIETYFKSDNMTMLFNLNFFSIGVEFSSFYENLWNGYLDEDPKQSSPCGLKVSNSNGSTASYLVEVFNSIGDSTGQCGLVLSIIAIVASLAITTGNKVYKYLALIYGVILLIFEIVVFVITTFTFEMDPIKENAALLGYGIGCLIAGFATYFGFAMIHILISLVTSMTILKALDLYFDIIGIKSGFFELFRLVPEEDLYWVIDKSLTDIIGGFIGLIVGVATLEIIRKMSMNDLPYIVAVMFAIIGVILIRYTLNI